MNRLAKFDIGRRFVDPKVRIGAQIAFGAGCTLAMIGLRSLIDVAFPTAGPFAMVYPTVLIATLYGAWQGGMVAYVTSFLWAWYFVLAPVQGFTFEVPTDPSRVAINAVAVLVVLVFAEAFRRAVTLTLMERDEEIRRRELLQQELEHRTRNNFALAASLLEMQKRNEQEPAVAAGLETAIARIHSFASAYANLAESQQEGASVAMQAYLLEVVDRVTRGAFHDNVAVEVDAGCPNLSMPREVAVAIGLFTNEALTNCAKYAFPEGRPGKVRVQFNGDAETWTLAISDDGVGTATTASVSSTGIGERLLAAFAQQARAEYSIDAGNNGRSLRLASQLLN